MSNKIFLCLILLLINACSSDSSWFGEKEKPLHPGKRISVLSLDKTLAGDKELSNIKINLPKSQNINGWLVSEINQNYNIPQNIALANNLKKDRIIKLSATTSNSDFTSVSPVISDNKIYTISNNVLNSYEISAETKLLWSLNFSENNVASNSYGGGLLLNKDILFVTTGNKEVYAVNVHDGSVKWKYSLSNISRSAPYLYNNMLFVLTVDNKLYVVDAKDGSLKWVHSGPPSHVSSIKTTSIVAKNNIVVVPYTSGDLYILNIEDGNELMQINTSNNDIVGQGYSLKDIDCSPVIDDNYLYAINHEGALISVDLNSGDLIWKKEIRNYRDIWLAGDFIYSANNNGEVISIYKKDGRIKWVNQIDIDKDITIYGPILAGNKIILTASSGHVIELSPYDGSVLNMIKLDEKISQFPLVANQQLYVIHTNSTLTVLK